MKYFPQENIFFLMGHGGENLHDAKRYKLKKNQYAAIPLNPGEQLLSLTYNSYLDIIWKDDSDFKIEIPKSGKKMTDNLGFGSRFGARLPDEKITKDVRIEDFKIYRPKMGDFDKQTFWYTLPDIMYLPTLVLHKYPAEYNTYITYKNVKYNDLYAMRISISGIISPTKHETINISDIDNFDKAYPYLFKNISDEDMEHYLLPPGLTNYELELHYPNESVLDKTINQIIKDRKKDPLTYDFYCWIKALYKASVIPLYDLIIINYSRYFEPDSAIEKYKKIKNVLSSKNELEKWINELFTLNNILSIRLKFKDVYDLLEEIVKPEGPYIIIPFICRTVYDTTSKTISRAKRKSRPGLTRKKKKTFI